MNKMNRLWPSLLLLCSLAWLTPLIVAEPNVPDGTEEKSGRTVLYLMSRGFGVNYFLDRDRFEEYGWDIVHAGVIDTVPPCPFYYYRYQIPSIVPDLKVADLTDLTPYDALAISTTSKFASPVPFDEFVASDQVHRLIRDGLGQHLAVYTVCHGSRVLAAADVIAGKEVICADKYRGEIENAGGIFVEKEHPPVIAGNIVTGARDQFNNFVNVQAIATVIENNSDRKGAKESTDKESIGSGSADLAVGEAGWVRTFGGSAADGARSLCSTGDGGYLLAGYSFSEGSGDPDILVIRTDKEGRAEWSRTYGGAGTEYAYGCAVAEDGHFVITGYTTSYGAGSKDIFLLKIDQKGKEVWLKTFGGTSWDVGRDLAVANNGDYLIGGFTHSEGAGEEDTYVVRTDTDGHQLWAKAYGGARFEIGNSICEADDGTILVGSSTGTFGLEGNANGWLLKLSAAGEQLWDHAYGIESKAGHGFDWIRSMRPTSDGGAVLIGYTDAEPLMNIYAVRTDAEGNETWAKIFGHSSYYDYGTSITPTADGGFAVCGAAKLVGTVEHLYNNQFYLAKLDAEGEFLWERVLGGAESDWASAVLETAEGDFVLAGHTYSAGAGSSDVLFLKVSGEAPPPPPATDSTESEN